MGLYYSTVFCKAVGLGLYHTSKRFSWFSYCIWKAHLHFHNKAWWPFFFSWCPTSIQRVLTRYHVKQIENKNQHSIFMPLAPPTRPLQKFKTPSAPGSGSLISIKHPPTGFIYPTIFLSWSKVAFAAPPLPLSSRKGQEKRNPLGSDVAPRPYAKGSRSLTTALIGRTI